MIPVLAVISSVTLLCWMAHRAERWYRRRGLIRELRRMDFDVRRLG